MNNIRDTELLQSFGKHLRMLRKRDGYSQEKLGFIAEVSKNQIGEIERGEINPTLCTLNAIAKALKISLEELVKFDSK